MDRKNIIEYQCRINSTQPFKSTQSDSNWSNLAKRVVMKISFVTQSQSSTTSFRKFDLKNPIFCLFFHVPLGLRPKWFDVNHRVQTLDIVQSKSAFNGKEGEWGPDGREPELTFEANCKMHLKLMQNSVWPATLGYLALPWKLPSRTQAK